MHYSSFLTLRPAAWLNDEVINYATKKLIQPLNQRTHCYNSHFFSRCLIQTAEGPRFEYNDVKRWSDRIPGGLDSLEDLYVPINKDNSHWVFIRVNFPTKTIHLYDSLRLDHSNSVYLTTMKHYLYAEYQRLHPGQNVGFQQWAQQWTSVDRSDDCPRQENGDDCGVFMILSMALLAQGIRLSASTYSQATVDDRQIRRRIAHIAWLDRLEPESESATITQWFGQRTTGAPPPPQQPHPKSTQSGSKQVPAKKALTAKMKGTSNRE